jgi:protein TonB
MGAGIEVTGTGLMLAVAGIALAIVAIILVIKAYYRKKSAENLAEQYQEAGLSATLQSRAKYPDVNPFNLSGSVFRFGLVAALGLTLLALSWTQFDEAVYIPDDALEMDEEMEIEPPRTAEPPPPPPPPPPPVIEEVPDEEILEEEEPEFMDMSVEEEEIIEEAPEPVVEDAPPPPPPPPPPPEPEVAEIFKVVEDMPRFPGCENEGSKEAKMACAQKKMLEYVYKNIKYPAIARENGIQGRAVVQFVVEKDGKITDAKVLRDPGAGTGAEALRVVNAMNNLPERWTPGKQRGKPVRVQFTLPVSFKLE